MFRFKAKVLTLLLGLMDISMGSVLAIAEEYKPGDVFKDCEECPSMVVVPAGSFMMGANPQEKQQSKSKLPRHKVNIGYDFAIGRYEISVNEFKAFLSDTGYKQENNCFRIKSISPFSMGSASFEKPGFNQTDNHPATCVSWLDAQAYTSWLSKKTGRNYRLPSEAEWEYVARGGTATNFWWGDTPSHKYANYRRRSGSLADKSKKTDKSGTVPIDSFPPNKFGLHGVHGNVSEWVLDRAHIGYKGAPSDGSAWYGVTRWKKRRRVRGGLWQLFPFPVTTRLFANENVQMNTLGLRVVREITNR